MDNAKCLVKMALNLGIDWKEEDEDIPYIDTVGKIATEIL